MRGITEQFCFNLVGFHLNYTVKALSLPKPVITLLRAKAATTSQANNENANFISIDDWKCAHKTAILAFIMYCMYVVFSTMFIDTESKECFHLFYFLNNINVTRCSLILDRALWNLKYFLHFSSSCRCFLCLAFLFLTCTWTWTRYQNHRGSSTLLTFADETMKILNSWKMKFYLKIPLP